MQLYLPIAEMSVNPLLILGLGMLVGFLSGLFGVGGGFLLTPLLIFIGVPPAVTVGTQAAQLVGTSVSGALGYWRRGQVDLPMAAFLLTGGLIGSGCGVWLFSLLTRLGQVDVAISLFYVLVLGVVGGLMLVESLRAIRRRGKPGVRRVKLHHHTWLHGLPFKMRFAKSRLYISALGPLGIGFAGGVIVAVMGVGGGFFMIPAMIYLIGMPTSTVPGTSLFQIVFVTAAVTVLQAVTSHTVDIVLALLLLVGSAIGAQFGTRFGVRLRGEEMRALLAALVLLVSAKLAIDLVLRPDELYSLSLAPGHG